MKYRGILVYPGTTPPRAPHHALVVRAEQNMSVPRDTVTAEI
ncbi:hypothetical protein [Rhodococcus pyridinivorans]|nr:hypothetical protein [Rhodococcus pyridinivorans]